MREEDQNILSMSSVLHVALRWMRSRWNVFDRFVVIQVIEFIFQTIKFELPLRMDGNADHVPVGG